MSWSVFGVILASALLHAGWNVLSKIGRPSLAFFTGMCIGNTLLWSWTLFAFDFPWRNLSLWFYGAFLFSVLTEYLYFRGIVEAYRQLDISLGYPMIRALPVLLITAATFLLPPHRLPGVPGGIGLLLVCAGCLLLPLKRFRDLRWSNYRGRAMKFIWLAAAGTTGYTLGDAFALRLLKEQAPGREIAASCFYLFLIQAGNAGWLSWCCFRRAEERREAGRILRCEPFRPLLAGVFSSTAYVLILYAMLHVAQLSFLQAFRQMSLPCGVLCGMLIFKEKVGAVRWFGLVLIVAGLVAIAFQ